MGWFSQGYPGHTKLILISMFVCQLCAIYIVVQRWILPRDIVRELPLRSLTSCMMECEGMKKCKTVGSFKDPEELLINGKGNEKCLMLKLVRQKNKNGTRTTVYALLDEETGVEEEKNVTKTAIKEKSCPVDVNGGYSEWSNFTVCSKSCESGVQYRNRTCNHPTPKFGGRNCSTLGNNTEVRSCNEHQCPINGGYGQWTSYGTFSKICGSGIQSRSRTCDAPTPQHGGKDCTSFKQSTESELCNTEQCPSYWIKSRGFCKSVTYDACVKIAKLRAEGWHGRMSRSDYPKGCFSRSDGLMWFNNGPGYSCKSHERCICV